MKPETLNILRSPGGCLPLRIKTESLADGSTVEFLTNDECGVMFPIREGIPVFVETKELIGSNKRYRNIYDRFAPYYDFISRVGLFFMGLSEDAMRKEFLKELEIERGGMVLETSVGTGSNFYHLPRDLRFYGFDLSWGMLRTCRKKMNKLGVAAELFLGEAEHLPFEDEVFDIVYQMGGINFFSDKGKAIKEMVRVAKKGTKIIIMDETEQVARSLERFPGVNAFFKDRDKAIESPLEFIPEEMEDIQVKELFNSQAWFLSFRKPL